MSQLAAALTGRGETVAWLNSTHFVGDDESVGRVISEMFDLKCDRVPSSQKGGKLDARLRDIYRINPKITIFVDDMQEFRECDEDQFRKFFKHRWPSLRLVLASRKSSFFGLARLQVNGELASFTTADLQFDSVEVANLLVASGTVIDPALKAQIEHLTEGWPAALSMLLPLMKKGLNSRKDIVSAMARPNGVFGQYVRDEIVGELNESVRRFVGAAATVGNFTTEMLTDLLHDDEVGSKIDRLIEMGLFLRMDSIHDDWYSFHPLFTALLENIFRRDQPALFTDLHLKAAAWHRHSGKLGEAISHAFAGRDIDLAADLLSATGSTLERIGRWRTFTSWTSRLPPNLLDRYPSIHIEAACAHGVLYEFEAARNHAEAARLKYDELDDRDRDDLLLADAIIATFSDQSEAALAAGERGFGECKVREPYTIGCMGIASAVGWIGRKDVAKARRFLLEAHAITREGGSPFGTIMSLALRGLTHSIEGDLDQAEEIWNEGEAIVATMDCAPAIVAVASGYQPLVLYERNRLSEADHLLRASFAGSVEIAFPDMVATLYLIASRTAFARGNIGEATLLLDEAEVTGLQRAWPRLVQMAIWERVRFALRNGNVTEATRHYSRIKRSTDLPMPGAPDFEGDQLAQFEYEAAIKPGRELLTRLRTATTQATQECRKWRAVRLLLISAIVRESTGDHFGALRAVRRAVELATPGRLIRTFVDAGDAIVRLVQIVEAEEAKAPSALSRDFLLEILTAANTESLERPPSEDPIDALSARELDVLQMLAAGLSNRELATRLFVTENTVKWHLQHVFSKLGVRNRTRAIVVARESGIIAH